MNILTIAQQHNDYREISPGQFVGPCPACGGALRFQIFPAEDRYQCTHCRISGTSATIAAHFPTIEQPPAVADANCDQHHDLTSHIYRLTARDGREINITDNKDAYRRLAAAGKIVFTSTELALVKNVNPDPATAGRLLDLKETITRDFNGAYFENIGPEEQGDPNHGNA